MSYSHSNKVSLSDLALSHLKIGGKEFVMGERDCNEGIDGYFKSRKYL